MRREAVQREVMRRNALRHNVVLRCDAMRRCGHPFERNYANCNRLHTEQFMINSTVIIIILLAVHYRFCLSYFKILPFLYA